jgi:hypothetical protein
MLLLKGRTIMGFSPHLSKRPTGISKAYLYYIYSY